MSEILPPPPPANINNEPIEQNGILKSQKLVQDIVIGVVVVLLVGLIGALIATGAILQNYLASKQATYEDLKDQIIMQNIKLDELIQIEEQNKIQTPNSQKSK